MRESGGSLRLHLVDDNGKDVEVIYVSLETTEELLGVPVTLEALQYISLKQAEREMITLLDKEEMTRK